MTAFTYLLGGALWWALNRLHPCGLGVTAEMLDFDEILEAEGV